MGWYFNQEKVTQAAALLVRCSGETRMQYLKLLKLLYFSDRVSLLEKGYPITGDQACAMKLGPVLSTVYDFIKNDDFVDHAFWDQYFRKDKYDLDLLGDPGTGKLSRYEIRVLTSMCEEHKDLDGFDASELSHLFPEWVEVNELRLRRNRGSEPIPIEKTLAALHMPQERIARIQEEIEDERSYFKFFEELDTSASLKN